MARRFSVFPPSRSCAGAGDHAPHPSRSEVGGPHRWPARRSGKCYFSAGCRWHITCGRWREMMATPLPGPNRRLPRWLAGGAIALVLVLVAVLLVPRLVSWLRPPADTGIVLASGRIEGRITTLTPKTSAWVVTLHADEGQSVRQGQLLATLDDQAQRERVRAVEEQV